MSEKIITKKDVDELERNYLIQEMKKDDIVFDSFLNELKKFTEYKDNSNHIELHLLQNEIKELLERREQ